MDFRNQNDEEHISISRIRVNL